MNDNPNYVPVDWASSPHPDDPRSELGNDGLTEEERDAGAAPMFEPPQIVDTAELVADLAADERLHEAALTATPDRLTGSDLLTANATLTEDGDVLRVGDRVRHIGDVMLVPDLRAVGVVEWLGPVEIHGRPVENGAKVRWPSSVTPENDTVELNSVGNLTVVRDD
jgi:hypothetical protein